MKVIAFDLFGTVFDLSGVPKQEIRDYVHHVKRKVWTPLPLPKSWAELPAFPDAKPGLNYLRSTYTVVSCSNAPLGLQIELCKRNELHFDGLIPLEINRCYKPNLRAYQTLFDVFGHTADITLVTANKDFGDLEAAEKLGMKGILIRNPDCPKDLIDLCRKLSGEINNGGSV